MAGDPNRADDSRWMGVREAAVELAQSYGQTLRLLEIGVLESRRTPRGRWMVSTASVKKLLASRQPRPRSSTSI